MTAGVTDAEALKAETGLDTVALGQFVFPENGVRITVGFVAVVAAYWALGHQIPQLWAGSAACLVFAFLALRTASGMRVVKALVSQSGAR